jgi:hypothetical protein
MAVYIIVIGQHLAQATFLIAHLVVMALKPFLIMIKTSIF